MTRPISHPWMLRSISAVGLMLILATTLELIAIDSMPNSSVSP